VHFEIEFPKSVNEEQAQSLDQVFAALRPNPLKDIGIENTHECIPFEKSHVNENKKDRNEAYDSGEEEQGEGRQGVQCQTQ